MDWIAQAMKPKLKPKLIMSGISAALLVFLAGCAGGATAAAGGPPRNGGTLRFAITSDAGCVDPQQTASNDSIYVSRQLVDSLTDQDPATGKIVPWLASSWDISADGTAYTFHLRKGVTFSDGTAVDAQAVKANFDSVRKLGAKAGLATSYLSGYAGTTVVDPLTAKVSFKRPNAQFLQASSTFSLGLVAKASIAKPADQRCTGGVIGSGPFVFQSYQANQRIVLTKRPGYGWGSPLWKHPGAAYLDKIEFSIVPESGVRAGSLQSGQLDAIASVGPTDEETLRGAGDTIQARPNPGVVFALSANHARPIVADPAVRQAISAAINRQELVDTVFTKETKPATSILASTTPNYLNLGSRLTFDPAKAGKLLDAAGWKLGPDGIRAKNGTKLRLLTYWFPNLGTNQPALELIQQQLKKVGVDLTLKQGQISQLVQTLKKGDYDLAWGNTTRSDPDVLRTSFSTTLNNYYRISAPALEKLLQEQAAATDPTVRGKLVGQVQTLVVQQADVVPVVELTTVIGVSPKVHDLNFEASSRLQFHDTWISA
jgi:peptide/nickel transport system substrate-binding protein